MLRKFEEANQSFAQNCTSITDKGNNNYSMVLGGRTNELLSQFNQINAHLKNPYQSLFYWIKAQVADVKAVQEALAQRENVIQVKNKVRAKKESLLKELDASKSGRTTLRTFFQSRNEKANFQEELEEQIKLLRGTESSYQKLTCILNQHWQGQIQTFKQEKLEDFSEIVRQMAQIEIDNSNFKA